MTSEHQKLYSPSQWSRRGMSADKVIENYLKILGEGSQWARTHLNTFTYKMTQTANEEEVIQFFYKSPQSFSLEADGSLNFHGRNVFVFLHGGYWQLGSVNHSSYMAKNFIEKNVIVAALGYNLCPKVTMVEQVEEVERAVAKILKFSGQSKIYLCGHSAGAHLAAMMLGTNFKQKYNVDSKNLAGLVLVSGIYDLVPMIETEENLALKLDTALAQRLSPIHADQCNEAVDKAAIDVMVAYGNYESPAFIEQSKNYAEHLKNVIRLSKVELVGFDTDHFDIIEELRDDDFALTQKVYKMMNCQSP